MNRLLLCACLGLMACSGEDIPAAPSSPIQETPDQPSPFDPGAIDRWFEASSRSVDTGQAADWMRTRSYQKWQASPGVTLSAQGGTRVFVNQTLADSLAQGATSHPVGAVGIRELYQEDLFTRRATNLLIKLEKGEGPETWLWLELRDFSPGAALSVEEPAPPGCVPCHSDSVDFIQSTWPL